MRFSVIVPVYNVAGYVESCLDSLLAAAAGHDVEILCVDDGSRDGSSATLDAAASRDRRIRVFHQPNAGVSAARNRGLEAATGDWLLFVDADDLVRPTFFETVEAGIVSGPDVDLVGFGMVAVYSGEPDWGEEAVRWRDVGIETEIADGLDGMSVYRFAYRRDVFGALRFPPFVFGEDLMYVTEALTLSRRCLITERREYAYRFRPDSATHVELKPETLATMIRFNVLSFRCLVASGKRIGDGFVRRRGGCWIEELPRVILGHSGEPGWDRLWSDWLDSMAVATDLPCLTDRQRRQARCVAKARTRWSVRLHCLLPAWLRRKGLRTCF